MGLLFRSVCDTECLNRDRIKLCRENSLSQYILRRGVEGLSSFHCRFLLWFQLYCLTKNCTTHFFQFTQFSLVHFFCKFLLAFPRVFPNVYHRKNWVGLNKIIVSERVLSYGVGKNIFTCGAIFRWALLSVGQVKPTVAANAAGASKRQLRSRTAAVVSITNQVGR